MHTHTHTHPYDKNWSLHHSIDLLQLGLYPKTPTLDIKDNLFFLDVHTVCNNGLRMASVHMNL